MIVLDGGSPFLQAITIPVVHQELAPRLLALIGE
jgi:hypothetical protein